MTIDSGFDIATYTIENTTFWIFLSTVLFAILLWRYGRAPLLTSLDARSDKIKQQIEEAEDLKHEAQEMLARYQQKQRDAIREADEILQASQQKVDLAREKAEKDLKETIDRYERQALGRIQRFEEQALREVKEDIVSIAIDTVEKHATENLTGDQREKLTKKSMKRATEFFETEMGEKKKKTKKAS